MAHIEEISLNDFSKLNLVSSQISKTSAERRDAMKQQGKLGSGGGSSVPRFTKFVQMKIDEGNDWVTFYFLTEATPLIYPKDHEYTDTIATTKGLESNPSKLYELQMRFLGISELKKTPEINAQKIKEWLWNTDFQVWNNAPSFHWQGFNYKMSQLDGSIHPTDIAPKVWNEVHGNTYLDKHLVDLFINLKFFLNQMAGAVLNKVKITQPKDKTTPKPKTSKQKEPLFKEPSANQFQPSKVETPTNKPPIKPNNPEVQQKPSSPNAPVQPRTLKPSAPVIKTQQPEEELQEPHEDEEQELMNQQQLGESKKSKILFTAGSKKGVFYKNVGFFKESVKHINSLLNRYQYEFVKPLNTFTRRILHEGSSYLTEYVVSLAGGFLDLGKDTAMFSNIITESLNKLSPDILIFNVTEQSLEESVIVENILKNLKSVKEDYVLEFIVDTFAKTVYPYLMKEKYYSVLFKELLQEEDNDVTANILIMNGNPIVKEHLLVIKKLLATAHKDGGTPIVFVGNNAHQESIFRDKEQALKKAFMGTNLKIENGDNVDNNIQRALQWVYEHHFRKCIVLCGENELQNIQTEILETNGKSTSYGNYEFEDIRAITYGENDPDTSESAIKGRNALLNKDLKGFMKEIDIPYISTMKDLFRSLSAVVRNSIN